MLLARIDPPRSLPVGPFHAWAFARPLAGGSEGGDRLAVEVRSAGLVFLLADAAGHGAEGQRLWDALGTKIHARWEELLQGRCDLPEFETFVRGLNDDLYEGGAHLALAVGALGHDGRLRFGVCGYGVHVLPSGPLGACEPGDEEPGFGLKLGWLSTEEWSGCARGFVGRELYGVSRVVVLSDGFLGEDHRDPQRTLRAVAALGRDCALRRARGAVDLVRALPHANDDATVLALETPRGT